jgi:signal transduction histidine kinase/DNA-binding NarL/FixJ family response regulator
LLVENNIGDAELLRDTLNEVSSANFDFKLVHVVRIEEAMESITQGSFDLVLLDLSLPDAHGLETVTEMRRVAPDLPIVVLSGLNDEQMAVKAMRKGAEDYLVKGQVDSETLVRSIRYAIERKRIETQIQQHQSRQAALHQIHLAVTSTLDLRTRLNLLLERIADYYPSYVMAVRLRNEENGNLETLACRNLDIRECEEIPLQTATGKSLTYAVLEARAPLAIVDMQNDPRMRRPEFARRNGLVSYLGVPLIVRDEVIGVLCLYTRERHAFSREEIDFLETLAGQTAIAIAHSRLFEQLKAAKEALEKSLDVKSVLVGVIAHELKTPIQVILGNANLLLEGFFGALTEEQQQRVRAIESGAEEVIHLIEDAIDMTRLDQGKIPLAVTEIPVGALLAELKSEFLEGFRKNGVDFEVSEPPSGTIVKSDRFKLKEILRNLLDNAQKFTPQGKVKVLFLSHHHDRVEFLVKDTGIGIAKEMLPKIFELFYQVDPLAQAGSTSAGLGLNIVKRLVAAISGHIDVASELGKGTTFRVVLPKEIAQENRPTHFDESAGAPLTNTRRAIS